MKKLDGKGALAAPKSRLRTIVDAAPLFIPYRLQLLGNFGGRLVGFLRKLLRARGDVREAEVRRPSGRRNPSRRGRRQEKNAECEKRVGRHAIFHVHLSRFIKTTGEQTRGTPSGIGNGCVATENLCP